MSQFEKLIQKLKRGSINLKELRTLMKQLGWELDGTQGSHEQWRHPTKTYPAHRLTIVASRNDLKPYQIKEAQRKLLGES